MKRVPMPDEEKGEIVMEILEPLGAGRFLARGRLGNEEIIAKVYVPGKMKRKRSSRINPGDYVLASLRFSESEKERRGEILHKYSKDEVRELKKLGLITEGEDEGLEFRGF